MTNKYVGMSSPYSQDFYVQRHQQTASAARAVLAVILDALPVDSVVDIGCGVGTWLSVAKEMGATTLLGIDGPWVDPALMQIDRSELLIQDLQQPIRLNRRFDLALSLEVAEHVPALRAKSFVSDLCEASDQIVFGAAVPDQGGVGHLNEQWQSYWAALFAEHDFCPIDCVRARIWSNSEIPWWYKQNTLLYVKRHIFADTCNAFSIPGRYAASQIDLIHPDMYSSHLSRYDDFGFLLRQTLKVFRRKLKNKLGRIGKCQS